ncbi:MAG: hypothetical protein KAX46_05550, partial [Chromatiaceae bacterium]|nr:hypothetical protein [Chromatiaceae bacterium]
MKRITALLAVLTLNFGISSITMAATGVEKQTAIDNALAWLASTQQADGHWEFGDVYADTAATGAALLAFIEEQQRTGWVVPGLYNTHVQNGLTYLLSKSQQVSITPQPAGNPDSDGNGVGVKFVLDPNDNGRDTYVTGLVVPALAKYIAVFGNANVASGPLSGITGGTGPGGAWTYKDVVVNAIDYFAFGQNDSGTGRGGWRYSANSGLSDNSTAQWPVIAALFASEPGVAAPSFVKDEMAYWIEYIQNANGGSGYDNPSTYVNESKTGGLLIEMVFAGDDTAGIPYNLGNADLQRALSYLNTNWKNSPSGDWYGNLGHPYAMWAIYKGLELTVDTHDTTYITNLRDQTTARAGGPAPLDPGDDWTWWEDYCEYLFGAQNANGSWNGYDYWTGPLATAWYVNILQGIRIPPPLQCAILGDQQVVIRAGSIVTADPSNVCSNGPLRTGGKVKVDSSLLALGNMELGEGTEVAKDAFTNGSLKAGAMVGGKVSIGFADGPGDLDVKVGGNVMLLGGTQVEGVCEYAGTLITGPGVGCGTATQDSDPPFANPFPLPECAVTAPAADAPDIKTPPKSTQYCDAPLQPGDYGNVSFGASNCVAIEAGEYHFQSLLFGPNTEVRILGPITLHVVDALRFADGVREVLAGQVEPKQVLYLVDGATG